VTNPNQLKWLEEQLELMGGSKTSSIGEQGLLNTIALDRNGRKFANCSSINLEYVTKGEGNVMIVPESQISHRQLSDWIEE
jgi:hypothetical protein